MVHYSYPPSKLENVDYSLFKQGLGLSCSLQGMFLEVLPLPGR